jgi:hypothetical protein
MNNEKLTIQYLHHKKFILKIFKTYKMVTKFFENNVIIKIEKNNDNIQRKNK